jgi:hypothetical protein
MNRDLALTGKHWELHPDEFEQYYNLIEFYRSKGVEDDMKLLRLVQAEVEAYGEEVTLMELEEVLERYIKPLEPLNIHSFDQFYSAYTHEAEEELRREFDYKGDVMFTYNLGR